VKYLAIAGAVFGLTGVILGAFGAHALRASVSAEWLEVWKTAVSYQMYHAPALLCLAWAGEKSTNRLLHWAGINFVLGIIVFSGSLYLLVLCNMPRLGMITPIGGSLLILGWLLLLTSVVRQQVSVDGK